MVAKEVSLNSNSEYLRSALQFIMKYVLQFAFFRTPARFKEKLSDRFKSVCKLRLLTNFDVNITSSSGVVVVNYDLSTVFLLEMWTDSHQILSGASFYQDRFNPNQYGPLQAFVVLRQKSLQLEEETFRLLVSTYKTFENAIFAQLGLKSLHCNPIVKRCSLLIQ